MKNVPVKPIAKAKTPRIFFVWKIMRSFVTVLLIAGAAFTTYTFLSIVKSSEVTVVEPKTTSPHVDLEAMKSVIGDYKQKRENLELIYSSVGSAFDPSRPR